MTDQPRTYLDPLHDELDRLRTAVHELEGAADRAEAAEHRAKQAEARVDQLTDQLNLANDTLRHRATAVNATGATNDQLRALVAQARTWIANCVDPAAVGIEVKRQMLNALSQEPASE